MGFTLLPGAPVGWHSPSSVDRRVNLRRDGLNLCAELLLYPVEVETVLIRHEVDTQAEVPEAPRPPDAMQVGLRVLREVEVDNDVHRLYVDAAREEVRGNEAPAGAVTEVVEHAVAVRLVHARVDEEAGVAQLCDLLGQELHARHGVAEDDGLVDLQLGEERVEAVHLLALLHEGVELRDAFERELVHEVDFVRLGHVLVLELHDGHGEGRGVHEDLSVRGQELQQVLDDGLELGAEQLVRLIHDHHLAALKVADALVREVQHAAGRRHHDVHLVVEAHDVLAEARATCGDHALHVHVLP
mmetsp:Transcript_60649/g.136491  ORF Transcript_60649/g.136491 Transcript_60649/m.136491 type:complete len:300 (-) Transcript_60649:54-953(-)